MPIDTLTIAKRLLASGMSKPSAEELARIIGEQVDRYEELLSSTIDRQQKPVWLLLTLTFILATTSIAICMIR